MTRQCVVRPVYGWQADQDRELKQLRWHWGDAYDIDVVDGEWQAKRKDGEGGTLTASGPDELRDAMFTDYNRKAVARDMR
jgi:hypothetical protein